MEDFSKDIKKQMAISPKMRSLLDKEKAESRKRIVETGIVHFRADRDFMEALLNAAEAEKIAPGTLCRHVVWDYLQTKQYNGRSLQAVPKRQASQIGGHGRVQEGSDLGYVTSPVSSSESCTPNEVREIIRSELQAFKREFHPEKKSNLNKSRKK